MSGPKDADALAYLPSGADKPSRIIRADGSEAHHRPGAPAEEAPTVVQSQLSNASLWDPPPLEAGTRATLVIQVVGAEPGDIVAAAHSALAAVRSIRMVMIAGSASRNGRRAAISAGFMSRFVAPFSPSYFRPSSASIASSASFLVIQQ